jgi:FAD/FMN-containing dehydrogenase
MEVAQSCGLGLETVVAGVRAKQLADILSRPSKEPYWKLRFKGGCQDLFFITTLDKTPEFVNRVSKLAGAYDFSPADIGVYLQPTVQGTNCHCEFNLSYDPNSQQEVDKMRTFDAEASRIIASTGGFFSRPYGAWADVAYGNNAETVVVQRKMKEVFDPNDIMNPGKLCF